MVTSSWLGGSADWSRASFWSAGVPDTDTDDAVIEAAGKYNVGLAAGETITVRDVTMSAPTGSRLLVDGTLSLAGTLTLNSGTVMLSGTIEGGAIDPAGGVLKATGTLGTLAGVTWEGAYNSNASQTINVRNGLTVTGTGGVGPGTINLTALGGVLAFEGDQTLDNATVNIGIFESRVAQMTIDASTLTLGPNLVFNSTGNENFADVSGSGTLVNQGQINVTANAGVLITCEKVVNNGSITMNVGTVQISSPTFTNNGVVSIDLGGLDLSEQPGVNFTNLVNKILTGGTYDLIAGGQIDLPQSTKIFTDNATIILDGQNSNFTSHFSMGNQDITLDRTLVTVGTKGILEILGDRNFAAAGPFTDRGVLQLGGGTFSSTNLTITAGRNTVLTGFGTVSAPITNSATILASGGVLDLTGAISGVGALQVGAASTLVLGAGVGANQTAAFTGAGATLALGASATVAATVSGFAAGDAIDIQNLTATAATLGAGDVLSIMNGGAQVASIKLVGDYTGDTFSVASDGAGGSTVTVSTGGGAAASHSFVAAMASLAQFAPSASHSFEAWRREAPMLAARP